MGYDFQQYGDGNTQNNHISHEREVKLNKDYTDAARISKKELYENAYRGNIIILIIIFLLMVVTIIFFVTGEESWIMVGFIVIFFLSLFLFSKYQEAICLNKNILSNEKIVAGKDPIYIDGRYRFIEEHKSYYVKYDRSSSCIYNGGEEKKLCEGTLIIVKAPEREARKRKKYAAKCSCSTEFECHSYTVDPICWVATEAKNMDWTPVQKTEQ